jgi:hypothetical protein
MALQDRVLLSILVVLLISIGMQTPLLSGLLN